MRPRFVMGTTKMLSVPRPQIENKAVPATRLPDPSVSRNPSTSTGYSSTADPVDQSGVDSRARCRRAHQSWSPDAWPRVGLSAQWLRPLPRFFVFFFAPHAAPVLTCWVKVLPFWASNSTVETVGAAQRFWVFESSPVCRRTG